MGNPILGLIVVLVLAFIAMLFWLHQQSKLPFNQRSQAWNRLRKSNNTIRDVNVCIVKALEKDPLALEMFELDDRNIVSLFQTCYGVEQIAQRFEAELKDLLSPRWQNGEMFTKLNQLHSTLRDYQLDFESMLIYLRAIMSGLDRAGKKESKLLTTCWDLKYKLKYTRELFGNMKTELQRYEETSKLLMQTAK